jgi:exopolyphosphatase/guanosine-5'-triphosphate,3'-diphosphate pyrophosphatase
MRIAAVDLGTNSTRLLVADVVDGEIAEVSRRIEITRLGEGVDETRRLRDAATGRVLETLERYAAEARELGADVVLAAATSAVRDAENGDAFLAGIERRLAFRTRLLSGDEEAALTFSGVTSGGPVAPGTVVLDIGGGSTELTLGANGGVDSAVSVQAGCVRLTERFLSSDPPTAAELAACGAHVASLLPTLAPAAMIGVAGTITTLAAVDLELSEYLPDRIQGHLLGRDAIESLYDRLRRATLAQRERILHLEPKRAPVIVAGAVILRTVMDAYGLDHIGVSDRDILHGIALAAAG